jgi:hypothetical protein
MQLKSFLVVLLGVSLLFIFSVRADYIPSTVIVNVSDDTTAGFNYSPCCQFYDRDGCDDSFYDLTIKGWNTGAGGVCQGSTQDKMMSQLWFNMSRGLTAEGNYFQIPTYLIKNVTMKLWVTSTQNMWGDNNIHVYGINYSYNGENAGNFMSSWTPSKTFFTNNLHNPVWYDNDGNEITSLLIPSLTPNTTVGLNITNYTINMSEQNKDVVVSMEMGQSYYSASFMSTEGLAYYGYGIAPYLEIQLNPVVCGDGYCTPINETLDNCPQDCSVHLTSCGSLSTPNMIYYLDSDVNNTDTCLSIDANNVTLDCQDNTIYYGSNVTYDRFGIRGSAGIANATIKNCRIVFWGCGFPCGGSYGIKMQSIGSNWIVKNVTIENNGYQTHGIYLWGGINHLFENLRINITGSGGASGLKFLSPATVKNSIVSSSDYYGMDFSQSASNSIVQDCIFDDLRVGGGSNNVSVINTTYDNVVVQDGSSLNRYWYLYTLIKDGDENPISNANVSNRNLFDEMQFSTMTNSSGYTERINALQYNQTPSGITYHTPQMITAQKSGYSANSTNTSLISNTNLELILNIPITTSTTTTTTTTTIPITTTIPLPPTTTISTSIPTGLNYTLTDIGQGVGNLLLGISPPLAIFIILLAVGSMVGFILSSLGKKSGEEI